MNPLSSTLFRRAELVVATDNNTTQAISILGFEIVAIITPATLDGATNDITFSIDPGDGTFRLIRDASGSAIVLTDVAVDEHLQVPKGNPPIVGSLLRLELSEAEAADRVFLVQLVRLP